jgi:hypothetical protein
MGSGLWDEMDTSHLIDFDLGLEHIDISPI